MVERPMLQVDDLQVYYGESHALQGVSFALGSGVLSIVGRNGMGKTTLCNTITGLTKARSGSIRIAGRDITKLDPHEIHRLGVGYVPQGRRVWPSLTVDEHLRLAAGTARDSSWTPDRVYQTFPRLAERRSNGGAQLSGGEQQMLAISRALLSDPKLLVMDEPTEGLAPVIVDQVRDMLVTLGAEGEMAILVIEQNIGVATSVSDQVGIMVNGKISRMMASAALSADTDMQQRLLGVGRQAEDEAIEPTPEDAAAAQAQLDHVYRVTREDDAAHYPVAQMPNRWNVQAPIAPLAQKVTPEPEEDVFHIPFAERVGRTVLVAGTFDTKARELGFIAAKLRKKGVPVRTVDLSTSGKPSRADVPAMQVASMARGGTGAVMTGERGASVRAMADAFAKWISRERGIGGIISAGGSGGTSLATAGMRALPFGIPKLMVSTVASGEVAQYVGASDIQMIHSVADVQGLNRITEVVLSNAAHAMAGMVAGLPSAAARAAERKLMRPAIGLTMFGVTTPLVQAVGQALGKDYDCLTFHATGIGGRAMEGLVDSGDISAVLDLTTTELADMLVGGVFPADDDRFGAVIRTRVPYVGSVGALDMVNFGPRERVPEKFNDRKFVIHNAAVTLMRTTIEESRQCGNWIGERLNQMDGPVRFLLPEGGVSALDAPGQPFEDEAARAALFDAIEARVTQTGQRQVLRVPAHINHPDFTHAVLDAFHAIAPTLQRRA
ncbi:ABC transporter permease [Roseobacter sp. EG26]|uniref:ABC transporter permease n=1 Tax=Roseobacter sp. EG26 TaxID=3412477 RepID=UPI003CE58EC4